MLPTDVLLDWKGRVVEDLTATASAASSTSSPSPRPMCPNGDASRLAGSVSGGGSFRVPYQGDGEGRTDLATTGWLPPAATLALRDYYWLGEEPPP